MALFSNDTDLFRRYVGVTVNYTMTDLLPQLERTTDEVLVRFLGDDLTTLLVEAAENLEQETDLVKKAVDLARICVARIGFVAHLPITEVQIGDDGITVTANEARKPAFEYQVRNLKRELSDSGWKALDQLIALVAKNADQFTDWDQAAYREEYESTLFKSPSEFSKYYPIQDRWLTFWSLRPFITAVEEEKAGLLKSRIEALPQAADQANLLKKLKRAVAYQAVLDGLPLLSIELNGHNVQVNYASQFGNIQYHQPPARDALIWVMENLQRFADLSWSTVETDLVKLESGPQEPPVVGSGLVDNTHSSIIMI